MRKFIIFAVLALSSPAQSAWLDKSHDIFFPRETYMQFSGFQSFPVFWWNFVVLRSEDFELAGKVCDRLREAAARSGVARAECKQEISDFSEIARDWALDLSVRMPKPPDAEIIRAIRGTLAQASLPADRALTDILRMDPFGTWQRLRDLASRNVPLGLERREGFFFDPESSRIVIPVLMGYPPKETSKTSAIFDHVFSAAPGAIWIGPHASTLQNERQVMADVEKVSIVGTLLILLFGAWLVWIKRWRLIWLLPPVLAATACAALLTIWRFGSIHGITLSFGTGIVGLALDFGLHAALAFNANRLWRANFFGLLTTLAGLGILMLSSIPLLKQMMFFSAAGLTLGFLFLYTGFRLKPRLFAAEPLQMRPRTNKATAVVAVVLVVCGFAGLATVRATWDLRKLEFQDRATAETADWLRANSKLRPPYFVVNYSEAQTWQTGPDPQIWAEEKGIFYEGVANYLPRLEKQTFNRASWRDTHCLSLMENLTDGDRKFFWPFLTHACDLESQINNRRYLDHLKADGQWLTMWVPKSDADEAAIRAQYPDSISLREVAEIFPNTLKKELAWMAPLAAILAALLIFIHFRNVRLTAVALIPFICGLGLISITHWLFGFAFSFVSLVGTVMIFGFSIDYGIFVAEATASGEDRGEGTWTAITFAALTTVAGYLPLIICKHPVLLHLGQALFFGTIGTYLGAFWGIPQFMKQVNKK
ncbi:MAG: hypothetical protein ABL958_07640 [Bdellovibrionia bacterium]